MSFKKADDIWFTIYQMIISDVPRASNRERINSLMVGAPPFTDNEMRDNKIFTNVNFLAARRVLSTAQLQARQAFLKTTRYFDWCLDTGPVAKRMQWGETMSNNINKFLKGSHKFTEVRQSQISSAVLHGIGPAVWTKKAHWCPNTRGIEDVLVPSLTLRDLSNLDYFAVFTTFTLSELTRMTSGNEVDPGWNMPLVKALCKNMERDLGSAANYARMSNWMFPEKTGQDIVENSAYVGLDSTPRVRCYDFYFRREVRGREAWCRRILLDRVNEPYYDISADETNGTDANEYLFNPGNRPYAQTLSELLHVQFFDSNPIAPFRYHNVRSTGMNAYAVGHLLNRAMCKLTDAWWESNNTYFRVEGGGDKERVQSIDLYNYGVIPEGVTVIPNTERMNINWQEAMAYTGGLQQSLSDMTSVWANPSQTGGSQQPTATQIVAEANNRNAMQNDMISDGMDDSESLYKQLCERFATSDHPDCKEFRRKCEKAGVDMAVFKDPDAWVIRAQRTIGGGNKAIEMEMVGQLRGMAAGLGPQAQKLIQQMAVSVYTDNPEMSELLVPDAAATPSSSVQTATLSWGTLMAQQPVAVTSATDHTEYSGTLLTMLFQKTQTLAQAMQQGQLPDMPTLQGLFFVSNTIQKEIQFISADPDSAEFVKKSTDYLAQVNNELKALAQRLQQAMKAQQPQADPKVAIEAAKAQQQMAQSAQSHQLSLQSQAQEHALTLQHRQQEHALDTAARVQELHQDHREHQVGIALDAARTASDIAIKRGSAKQAAKATAEE